jgi:hypothetical protein
MSTTQSTNRSTGGEVGQLPTIDLEDVSISQLLGRDYIFIDVQHAVLPMHNTSLLHSMLDTLMTQLELTEAHAVVVSVQELASGNIGFTRHDLTWDKHKICNVENTEVTQLEQQEFMDMIWRCSTPASTIY